MKKLLGLLAFATLAVSSDATAQNPMMMPLPARIMTSGEGQIRVTPDRATVLIGVQTRALTAAVAAADNARRQKAILDTLKSLGIPAEQIATQNYSVSPEMRYEPNTGVGKVTGYNVSNTVRIELKRIDQVGSVIDASLAKGANQINGVQFSVSTSAEARRTAMGDAVRDARADAEALARAAGGSLGALVELTSTSSPVPRPIYARMDMAMGKAENVQTPIEAGEQIITATVSVTWLFVPGTGR